MTLFTFQASQKTWTISQTVKWSFRMAAFTVRAQTLAGSFDFNANSLGTIDSGNRWVANNTLFGTGSPALTDTNQQLQFTTSSSPNTNAQVTYDNLRCQRSRSRLSRQSYWVPRRWSGLLFFAERKPRRFDGKAVFEGGEKQVRLIGCLGGGGNPECSVGK